MSTRRDDADDDDAAAVAPAPSPLAAAAAAARPSRRDTTTARARDARPPARRWVLPRSAVRSFRSPTRMTSCERTMVWCAAVRFVTYCAGSIR